MVLWLQNRVHKIPDMSSLIHVFPQVPYFSRAWQCVVQIPLLSGIFLSPEMLTVAFYSFVYRHIIGFVLVSLCLCVLVWAIFKVFLEFATILLLFHVFGVLALNESCGILAPWPGIESALLALGGEVLTNGLPGKSTVYIYIF